MDAPSDRSTRSSGGQGESHGCGHAENTPRRLPGCAPSLRFAIAIFEIVRTVVGSRQEFVDPPSRPRRGSFPAIQSPALQSRPAHYPCCRSVPSFVRALVIFLSPFGGPDPILHGLPGEGTRVLTARRL